MIANNFSVKNILAAWDEVATSGMCAYCQDFGGTVLLPLERGKPACNKCFRSICYDM